MTATLASHVLDCIRDHMRACTFGSASGHRDDEVSLWVCSARDNDGPRWVAKHEDFYGAAGALAGLVGFGLEDGWAAV